MTKFHTVSLPDYVVERIDLIREKEYYSSRADYIKEIVFRDFRRRSQVEPHGILWDAFTLLGGVQSAIYLSGKSEELEGFLERSARLQYDIMVGVVPEKDIAHFVREFEEWMDKEDKE